jgi:Tfp pilus assembly protein PilF
MSDKFPKENPETNPEPAKSPSQPDSQPVLGRYEDFEDTADLDEKANDDEYFKAAVPTTENVLEWEDDDPDDEDYGEAELADTDDEDDFEDDDELEDDDDEEEDELEDEDDEADELLDADEFEDDDEFEDEDELEEEAELDEDEEEEAGGFSQDQLINQLTSNPLFAQVQQMLTGSMTGPEKTFTQARMMQATGDLEGAAQLYLDVIDEAPDHFKAHVALAQVLLAMDKPQEAETFLRKAISLDPEDASSYLYLGYAHYAEERFEDCIEDFKKAVALDKGNALALNNLGFVQYLTGRLDEAAATFTQAGDFGSDRAYYNLGLVRLIQGRESEGWSAYLEAFDLDPSGRQIEDHLVDVQKALLKYPAAAPLLDDAITRLYSRYGDAGEDYDDADEED